jgi:hypothetical protein
MNGLGARRIGQRITALLLAATWAWAPLASRADELSDMKAQLEAAQKSIADLQRKVDAMSQQPGVPGAATNTVPPPADSAPVIAPNQAAKPDTKEPAGGRVEIYGFAQLDAIYDFDRVDPNWEATLRPSKIPVNCPPNGDDAGCGTDGEFLMSVRQTRLGFNGFLPTSMGELKTKFEFDLFGVGDDAGQTTIRVRQAYGSLGQFLLGQANTLFMDGSVFPNTIDYWGPSGMIYLNNPQIRWTAYDKEGTRFAVALEAPNSAVDPGNINDTFPDLNGSGKTEWPDLTAQLRFDRDWGHLQAAAVLRSVGYEVSLPTGFTDDGNEFGWGVNLSGTLNVTDLDRLHWQIVYGEAIASYINDCCVDLAPNADAEAESVPLLGWLLYYDHWWTSKWSSSIGFSQTWQDNTDGQLADAQEYGDYFSTNLLWYPVRNVMTGFEFLWGQRENKDSQDGDDFRLQYSAQFKF